MIISPLSGFNEIARRPSPLLVEIGQNSDVPCESNQDHHLIPHDVWDKLVEDPSLEVLAGGREHPRNLMTLPSTSAGAAASNLALHNGSHPAYTERVRGEMNKIVTAYHAAGGSSNPVAMAGYSAAVGALEDSLRARLDRTQPVPQLLLSGKDPNAFRATPEHQAETVAQKEAAIAMGLDMATGDPRSAYPNGTLAQENCETARQLTAQQLREIANAQRAKAWAGAGEEQETDTRSFADKLQAAANEHPFHAGMAKVGVGMMAVAALPLVAGETALTALGGVATRTAPAAVAGLLVTQDAQAALPEFKTLNQGNDQMGVRNSVDHISWRFTGLAHGDPGNTPEALYLRDMETGKYSHSAAHLLVKTDGSIVVSEQFMRPFGLNPQIEAGNNGNALGVYVEGDGNLTAAQRQSLSDLNDSFGQQRMQAGETSPSALSPATWKEDMAWQGNMAPDPVPDPAFLPPKIQPKYQAPVR